MTAISTAWHGIAYSRRMNMINNKIGWLKAAKFWFNKAESMDDVAAKLAEEAMWRCLFRWVVGKDLDFEI